MKLLCILLLGVIPICPIHGKDTFGKKKDKATRLLFYDLNKNGQMDTYENPSAPVEERVEHLLSQMTLEEKVGQMLTSLGWPMYERVGEEIRLTARLEKEISEYHIGALWGFMRADPWTQRTLHTGLNPSLAARASNRLQAFVMEHSRLGIPLFLAEECPHGHMAIGTTVFPTSIGQASTWNPGDPADGAYYCNRSKCSGSAYRLWAGTRFSPRSALVTCGRDLRRRPLSEWSDGSLLWFAVFKGTH